MARDLPGCTIDLARRMQCVEGQLQALVVMIESDVDYRSIIHQIRGIQRTLCEVKTLIVNHHLTTCLAELLIDVDIGPIARERSLTEVMSLYHLLNASRPPPD